MLLDFLQKHGVDHTLNDRKHGRSGWVQCAPCPRCSSENYHLGIKLDGSRASCYKCGHWGVPKLLKELTKASWPEIYALLAERAYHVDEQVERTGVYTPPTSLVAIQEQPAVLSYVTQRGFNPAYLETVWGCRATAFTSDYPFRLFIPIYLGKKAVSWTARAASGQEPRYVTAKANQKSFDEKKLLFGAQYCTDACVVSEGPFDAMRIGKGAVATLGTAYTQAQVNRLADYKRRVICFDNSDDAQRRARTLAEQLAAFGGETFVVCLDAPDPAEATASEIWKLREFAFGRGT